MQAVERAEIPLFDGEHNALVCLGTRRETHDVMTFCFAGRTPCRFAFRAGQYMTLELPVTAAGGVTNRCYSIVSPPTRPDRISLTVKRTPGGLVSGWMHENVVAGTELRALGPFGDFCLEGKVAGPADKLLFLSGGSGVTPLMSMARALSDLGGPVDVVFVHSARSPRDIIFRAELSLMAAQVDGFRLVVICEDDAEDERWGGHRGRLSKPLLALVAPDLLERRVFTCGPRPYMAAVRDMLADAGFDMARHHEESFVFEEATAARLGEVAPGAGPSAFRVELSRTKRVIECDRSVNVLEAARAAGLRLPFSCAKGVCGTCKTKLVSGQVAMNHGGGIRQREIDQGQILLCCSLPLSDLVIDR